MDNLPTTGDTAKLSGAELVRQYANTAQCANCHSKIDPLGVGLENFDSTGRFRTREIRLNPNIAKLNRKQRKNKRNLVISVSLCSPIRLEC